jgi:hypothetical protein
MRQPEISLANSLFSTFRRKESGMPVLNTDAKSQRVVDLLTKLATPSPPFLQPWEYQKWISTQEDVFFELYKKHQSNPRVLALLREVDGGSRCDVRYSEPTQRAIELAPRYLRLVLRDIEETNTCPTLPPTNDPLFNAFADGNQVIHNGFGSEWGRQAVRERNKRIQYETGSDGYVREKQKF